MEIGIGSGGDQSGNVERSTGAKLQDASQCGFQLGPPGAFAETVGGDFFRGLRILSRPHQLQQLQPINFGPLANEPLVLRQSGKTFGIPKAIGGKRPNEGDQRTHRSRNVLMGRGGRGLNDPTPKRLFQGNEVGSGLMQGLAPCIQGQIVFALATIELGEFIPQQGIPGIGDHGGHIFDPGLGGLANGFENLRPKGPNFRIARGNPKSAIQQLP